MKRTLSYLMAIASMAAIFSCNKEVATDSAPSEEEAGIEAYTLSSTKATWGADTTSVIWEANDCIRLERPNGNDNYYYLAKGAGTSHAFFKYAPKTIWLDYPMFGTYTLYYPATFDGVNWPTEQTYVKDNVTGAPMTASITFSHWFPVSSVKFENAGGIFGLNVKVKSKPTPAPAEGKKKEDVIDTLTFNKVVVTAGENEPISLNIKDSISLTNAVAEDPGTNFNFALPAGSYTKFKVEFVNDTTVIAQKELKATKEVKAIVIERSKVTTASMTIERKPTPPTPPTPHKK